VVPLEGLHCPGRDQRQHDLPTAQVTRGGACDRGFGVALQWAPAVTCDIACFLLSSHPLL
jgi:hypothetical protein